MLNGSKTYMFFPVLLGDLMKKGRLGRKALARMLQIKDRTLLNILSGKHPPSLPQITRLTNIFPVNKNEILWSGLYWMNLRMGVTGWDNFNMQHFIEYLIHHNKMSGITIKYLLGIWEQLDEGPCSITTKLLIPPQPPLVILDSCASMIREILRDGENLYRLHWKEFEDLIAYLLGRFGWSVEPMGYTKDDNVDILALKSIDPNLVIRMMVQCKKYSKHRKVGVDIVREVWSTKWEKGYHAAMIITSSFFTNGAMRKAQDLSLELSDHNSVVNWCKKYGALIGDELGGNVAQNPQGL